MRSLVVLFRSWGMEAHVRSTENATDTTGAEEPQALRLDLPAEPSSVAEVRHRVAAWLAQAHPGVVGSTVDDLVLALSEAVTNGVEHAHGSSVGRVVVSVTVEPDAIAVEVRDEGVWREQQVGDDTRGNGLLIVAALSADTLQIDRGIDGTVVRFSVPLAPDGDPGASTPPAAEPSSPPVLDEWFQRALDAVFDDVAIGEAIRDGSGAIVDFEVVYVNAGLVDGAGRSGDRVAGRRLLELFPAARDNGLLDRFIEVVETGEDYVHDRMEFHDLVEGDTPIEGYWSMNVVRFGDGYIAATRDVTALVAQEERRHHDEFEARRNQMAVELLQQAALPASIPVLDQVEIAASYRPARNEQPVGGDWYDVFELGDHRLGLVIADVAGHGPRAAAFMVQVRNIVRTLAFEHREPDAVLAASNRMVCRINGAEEFATCCYAVLDVATLELRWASAGHLAPLRLGPDPGYLPTLVGVPLGVDAAAVYEVSTAHLGETDRLVLFTDGMVEERGRTIEGSLAGLLDAEPGLPGDASAVIERLTAQAPLEDDLAIVCVAPRSPTPRRP